MHPDGEGAARSPSFVNVQLFGMLHSARAADSPSVLIRNKDCRVTLCCKCQKRGCETRAESGVRTVGVEQRWRLTMVVKRASPALDGLMCA